MSGQFTKYFHTVRHLRMKQIFFQIRRGLWRRRLCFHPFGGGAIQPLSLVSGVARPSSWCGCGRFTFLNQKADLGEPIDWGAGGFPRLWRYNLHYFDYLQQPELSRDAGLGLIRDWIKNHPVLASATGWEPYPISLRIVNWLKFLNRIDEYPAEIVESLALQAENLRRQVEYHILGNHLFANGKALWWVGLFLGNENWRQLGRQIILKEIPKQFLPDGGHFELSPMYHSLMVEDLLDLVNLVQADRSCSDPDALRVLTHTAVEGLSWLDELVDPGAALPLLNDSAYGIAPSTEDLKAYAQRLGIKGGGAEARGERQSHEDEEWSNSSFSGYQVFRKNPWWVLFDTALIGPDYLPGHAHCDMLSVLLSYGGRPILTDTGVFDYDEGKRRHYSRGTAAHNTVQIDGLEQAEIWKSFRVGRRGYPEGLTVGSNRVSCRHSGFSAQRSGLGHQRSLLFHEDGFEIEDVLWGSGQHTFTAFFHFAPDVTVERQADNCFLIDGQFEFEATGVEAEETRSEYYPEYGRIEMRPCLRLSGDFDRTKTFTVGFRKRKKAELAGDRGKEGENWSGGKGWKQSKEVLSQRREGTKEG